MHTNKFALFLATAFLCSTVTVGCSGRRYYRVYDPEYHDYHRWDNNEAGYYHRWEFETHRQHEDFRRRSREDQNEYWNWRHHREGGNGHDHGGSH